MWCMLVLLSTAACKKLVLYKFNHNYGNLVHDWSLNNLHAENSHVGSQSAVNTPYGLYLSGVQLKLPPNSHTSSKQLSASESFHISLFVRLLPSLGNGNGEVMSFLDPNLQGLQLRQLGGQTTSFELVYQAGGAPNPRQFFKDYEAEKWYLFSIDVFSLNAQSTEITLCINGAKAFAYKETGLLKKDWEHAYLNGGNTRAIYYRFEFDDTYYSYPCAMGSYVIVSKQLGGYVYPDKRTSFYEVSSFNYDIEGKPCSECGNYGCIKAPSTCMSPLCPPWPYDDSRCNYCYPHSNSNKSGTGCECIPGYYRSQAHPLVCLPCEEARVSSVAAKAQCSSCYSHSYNSKHTCECSYGFTATTMTPTELICSHSPRELSEVDEAGTTTGCFQSSRSLNICYCGSG
mmetsp:Transcript_16031/g.29373  ORF Transcript_16031/g.29373 Transcript_16031/m.29373 type:complete len:400 (+) Transcript_16031:956-2155(+)